MGQYFPEIDDSAADPKLDPVHTEAFEASFRSFIDHLADDHAIDDDTKSAILDWWKGNRQQILTGTQMRELKNTSLEVVVGEAMVYGLQERAQKEKDVTWFQAHIARPVKHFGPSTALAAFVGILVWAKDTIKGAMVAGPAADTVRAFVEPVVRPFRETVGKIGQIILKPISVWSQRKATDGSGAKMPPGVLKEMRSNLGKFGIKFTDKQVEALMKRNKLAWINANQNGMSMLQQFLKDGRGGLFDVLLAGPAAYSSYLSTHKIAFKQAREKYEALLVELDGKIPREELEAILSMSKTMVVADPDSVEAKKYNELRQKIMGEFGAEKDQIAFARLLEERSDMEIARYQMASTMAVWASRDFQFYEINLESVEKGLVKYSEIKRYLGRGFFSREIAPEMQEVLQAIQFVKKNDPVSPAAECMVGKMAQLTIDAAK